MMKLTCKDMGMDCPFEAEGETTEDVKNMMSAHGMEAHADMMNAMSDEEKAGMMSKMDEMMQTM